VDRGGERLPDGFSFEDFLDAVRDADEGAVGPDDADLPTDGDGCVELATVPAVDLPAFLGRLRDAGFSPHVEMPDDEPVETATATVFVPWPRLDEARRLLGLQP
jgi:hypothetical protein